MVKVYQNNLKILNLDTTLNKNDFENLPLKDFWKFSMQKQEINNDLEKLKNQFDNASDDIKARFDDKVAKIQQGDDLLPNSNESCKSFCCCKKKINARR